MSPSAAGGGLQFVVSTGTEKAGPELRKFIRSHVMQGKNKGKKLPPRTRKSKAAPLTQESAASESTAKTTGQAEERRATVPPTQRLEELQDVTLKIHRNRFPSASGVVYADKTVEPCMVELVFQFSTIAKSFLFPLEQCIAFYTSPHSPRTSLPNISPSSSSSPSSNPYIHSSSSSSFFSPCYGSSSSSSSSPYSSSSCSSASSKANAVNWTTPLVMDPAYLHAIIYLAQCFFDSQSSPTNAFVTTSKKSLPYFIKTIQLLRERFGENGKQEDRVSLTTIGAVTSLAALAHAAGDETNARNHLEGLYKIVEMRGGIASFDSESWLTQRQQQQQRRRRQQQRQGQRGQHDQAKEQWQGQQGQQGQANEQSQGQGQDRWNNDTCWNGGDTDGTGQQSHENSYTWGGTPGQTENADWWERRKLDGNDDAKRNKQKYGIGKKSVDAGDDENDDDNDMTGGHGGSEKVLTEVLRTDVGIALYYGTRPRFFRDAGQRDELYDLPNLRELVPGMIPQTVRVPDEVVLLNNRELKEIWRTLQDFSAVANYAIRSGTFKISIKAFLHCMSSVMYRLLDMEFSSPAPANKDESSIDEVVRLGLLAYTCSVFLHWKRMTRSNTGPYPYLAGRFRKVLRGMIRELQPEFGLWLVMVGAVSVFDVYGEDAEWIGTLLGEYMGTHKIQEWEGLRTVMDGFMWVGIVHDVPARQSLQAATKKGFAGVS